MKDIPSPAVFDALRRKAAKHGACQEHTILRRLLDALAKSFAIPKHSLNQDSGHRVCMGSWLPWLNLGWARAAFLRLKPPCIMWPLSLSYVPGFEVKLPIRLFLVAAPGPPIRLGLNARSNNMLEAVELVVKPAGDEGLQTYIATMQQHSPSKKLADAPPCAKYRDLITLDELERFSEEFFAYRSKLQFAEAHKRHAVRLSALRELLSSSEGALEDIKKAAAQKQKVLDARKAASVAGPAAKKPRHAIKQLTLGDFGGVLEHVRDMATVRAGELGVAAPDQPPSVNVDAPFIVTSVAWATDMQCKLKAEVGSFMPVYMDSSLKKEKGRGQRVVRDAALQQQLQQKIAELIPAQLAKEIPSSAPPFMRARMEEALLPSLTAMQPGQKEARLEKDGLPCAKVNLQGTREVVVAALGPLRSFMAKAGIEPERADLSAMYKFLASATQEQIRALSAANEEAVIWKGTHGPGDMLFVPGGFIQVQRTMAGPDVLAVRLSLLPTSPRAAEHIRAARSMVAGNVVMDCALGMLG